MPDRAVLTGTKHHLAVACAGVPLVIQQTAAHRPADAQGLALVAARPAVHGRREHLRPDKVHAG